MLTVIGIRAALPNTMQIAVCIRGAIVVDNNVDTLNIDTTTENIGSHQDTFFERLEGGVPADTVIPVK